MPEWLTGPLQVFDLRRSPFAGRAFRSGKSIMRRHAKAVNAVDCGKRTGFVNNNGFLIYGREAWRYGRSSCFNVPMKPRLRKRWSKSSP